MTEREQLKTETALNAEGPVQSADEEVGLHFSPDAEKTKQESQSKFEEIELEENAPSQKKDLTEDYDVQERLIYQDLDESVNSSEAEPLIPQYKPQLNDSSSSRSYLSTALRSLHKSSSDSTKQYGSIEPQLLQEVKYATEEVVRHVENRMNDLESSLHNWAEEHVQPLLAGLNLEDDEEAKNSQSSKSQNQTSSKGQTETATTESASFKSLDQRQQSNPFCRALYRLDSIDRRLSSKLHNMQKLQVELILIVPAHFFNRLYCAISILMSWLIGYFRYDVMLEATGFEPLGSEIAWESKVRLGFVFMSYYGLCLLIMVTSTQIIKYTVRRQRPEHNQDIARLNNLRKAEAGTFAMPSGDSAAAACFCFTYAAVMQLHAVYICLPFVCLGRVYYQCHWLGDTIMGSLIGTFWAIIGFLMFQQLVPLMELVAGQGTFNPQSLN